MTTAARQALPRPQGPCDIYAVAGAPCVAAHSTTRAFYASYKGPIYQVMRQSDSKTLDIGVVQPAASPVADVGGYRIGEPASGRRGMLLYTPDAGGNSCQLCSRASNPVR